MALRFEDTVRIVLVSSCALLACTTTDAGDKGAGVAGSSAGGTAASAGAATGGGGSNPGSAGSGTAGITSGGAATGGGGAGGSASGGAGSSMGGSAGAHAGTGGSSGGSAGGSGGSGGSKSKTTFFVTSDTSKTGKLGGLDGADKRCQDLATKAGFGDHTFHAYLSTSTVNAKARIGNGPWVNSKGLVVAPDLATLHSAATKGDHSIFIDENGMPIHGQWDNGPVEHDVLTGSMPDGTVQPGKTCQDWTSDAAADTAWVGHSDGMGPSMATTGTYTSWNSSHENGGCNDTAPKGGAGRLYCFAID